MNSEDGWDDASVDRARGLSDSLTTETTHATISWADDGGGDSRDCGGRMAGRAGSGRARHPDLHGSRADDRVNPTGMGQARCSGRSECGRLELLVRLTAPGSPQLCQGGQRWGPTDGDQPGLPDLRGVRHGVMASGREHPGGTQAMAGPSGAPGLGTPAVERDGPGLACVARCGHPGQSVALGGFRPERSGTSPSRLRCCRFGLPAPGSLEEDP